MLRRPLMVDLAPLRGSPAYRRLWVGGTLSAVGGQMTVFAVLLQVYLLSHRSLLVGLVGLAFAVPAVVVGLLGGAVVDAYDRRRLVLAGTAVQAALSCVLAAQAIMGPGHLWLLYTVTAVQAAVGGVNAPARRTFMPTLLPRDQLGAGAALQLLGNHVSATIGPAVAGLLTATGGLRLCYLVDAASFAAALYAVARLPVRPVTTGGRPTPAAVAAGMRFIAGRRALLGALASDAAMVFLGMPVALFPAINAARFGGHPGDLGLLSSALAVGGIVGAVASGPTTRLGRPGVGMLVAGGVVWGGGLVWFGLAGHLWAALVALVLAGAGDASSVVLRTAVVQGLTPDEVRGRVIAAEFAVGVGVSQLGNFRAGVVSSLSTPTVAAVGGGVTSIVAAAILAITIPAMVRLDRREVFGPPADDQGG